MMGTADEDSGSLDSDSDLVITFKGRLHCQSLMQKRMRDCGCVWIGRKIVGSTVIHLYKTYIPLFDVIGRQAGRQAGRQTARQADSQVDSQTYRQPDSQADKRKADRQVCRQTNRQTDKR
jgi:hypothetical protein